MVLFLDLPDEVLLDIVFWFAQRPQSDIFFLEHCVDPSLRNAGEDALASQEASSDRPAISTHYPHAAVTSRCRRGLPAGQIDHCADWLVLNTTCRRIRRLGKDVFFQTRCFAMTAALPGKLQRRGFSPTLSEADQELALAHIKEVAFVDENHNTPSGLLSLPRRLAVFPSLCSCVLVYGYRRGEGYRPVREAVAVVVASYREDADTKEGQPESREITWELRDLLRDIGVPKDIHVDLAYPPGVDRDYYRSVVRQTAYPMLHFKAQALQAQATTTVSST
jgi:hypothetical protein